MITAIYLEWVLFHHAIECDNCGDVKRGLNWGLVMISNGAEGEKVDEDVKMVLCQDCKKLLKDDKIKTPK